MSLAMSMTAFAGQWMQDTTGWWYQNDDQSYLAGGWNWVDGRCYYFTPEGYCLLNTQTPDGYMVDASGAWIVDGVVQTQTVPVAQPLTAGATVPFGNATFTVPTGYIQDMSLQDGYYFVNGNNTVIIGFYSQAYEMNDLNKEVLNTFSESLLDYTVTAFYGMPNSKNAKQFPSGTWYCYSYNDASNLGIPGALHLYGRIVDSRIDLLIAAGAITAADSDHIMNTYLR